MGGWDAYSTGTDKLSVYLMVLKLGMMYYLLIQKPRDLADPSVNSID